MNGTSADVLWATMSMEQKKVTVKKVAQYLLELFQIRFDKAGSLYICPASPVGSTVGPIIDSAFYRAVDGLMRFPDPSIFLEQIRKYQGPYTSELEWLKAPAQAELHYVRNFRDTAVAEACEEDVTAGERVICKFLELCDAYFGRLRVFRSNTFPDKPFGIRMDDFRLSNVMASKIKLYYTHLKFIVSPRLTKILEMLPRLSIGRPQWSPQSGTAPAYHNGSFLETSQAQHMKVALTRSELN